MAEQRPDIAIIGAGVVGLCTALQFLRAGYAVTLYDRDTPAKQTSFGNAGYLAAEYSEPLASAHNIAAALALSFSQRSAFKVTLDHLPGFMPWAARFINAARPARVKRNRIAIQKLNAHVIAAWKDILGFAGATDMMLNSGFLKLWEQSENLPDALKMQQAMHQAGIDTELLQGPLLRECEPALTSRIHHALLFPGAWQLSDPYAVCMALFASFQQHGGQFETRSVSRVIPQNNGVRVHTGEGQADFKHAVITAGAWSKSLLKAMGLSVPLAAERGYHLTLPDHDLKPQHILESVDRHVVLSSLTPGLRIVGFGEYARLNSKPVKKRHQQLQRHLKALIRGVNPELRTTESWMGIRPTLPDSLPVIDLHPKYPQIGFAFGHHHLGVTQAAISAQMISTMMTEGKTSPGLAPFSGVLDAYAVDRFGWI